MYITDNIRDIAEHSTMKIGRKSWEYYDRDEASIVYNDGVFWYERSRPSKRIHEWTGRTVKKVYGAARYLHDIPCPVND